MYLYHEFTDNIEKYDTNTEYVNGEFYGFMVNGDLEDPGFMTIEDNKIKINYSFKIKDILEFFKITKKHKNIDINEVDENIKNSLSIYKTFEGYI